MKTTIVLTDNIKQVIFTPENDSERQALKMIPPDDNIDLAIKEGSFYGSHLSRGAEAARIKVERCQGGYLRAYDDYESIILVLTPKKEATCK